MSVAPNNPSESYRDRTDSAVPEFICKSLWSHQPLPDVITIPSYAQRSLRRGLSLSTNFAIRARKMEPNDLREIATRLILKQNDYADYGFLHLIPDAPQFALLQVGINPDESADPDILRRSLRGLGKYARSYPEVTFGLPYPGVRRHDNLDPLEILHYLRALPGNVRVHLPIHLRPILKPALQRLQLPITTPR